MRYPIRLAFAYVVAAATASVQPLRAQEWPDRPVRIIMPYAPGGAGDAIARPWAEKLTQAFNQQFVVENRAPMGTPPEVVEKLNKQVVAIARTDDMKARMRALSVAVPVQTPEELGRHLVEDISRNLEVIKAANIKLD